MSCNFLENVVLPLDAQTQLRYLIRTCPSGGMVDAGDSKSPAARRAGSSPALGTIEKSGSSSGPLFFSFLLSGDELCFVPLRHATGAGEDGLAVAFKLWEELENFSALRGIKTVQGLLARLKTFRP